MIGGIIVCVDKRAIILRVKPLKREIWHLRCRHERYCHPDIVLKDPSATLLSVDEDHAIFVDCGDVDVHDHIKTGPFFYINQFNHCKRIIQIPIPQFMKLMEDNAEASPTSDVNLILLSNTGRCGSTLLTQLFEKQVRSKANHEGYMTTVCTRKMWCCWYALMTHICTWS